MVDIWEWVSHATTLTSHRTAWEVGALTVMNFPEADGDADVCKGNPHNCVKTKYHRMASMSDKQKNEMRRKEIGG